MPGPTAVRTLATDLDGTFLGGDAPSRRRLYDYLETHRDRLHLVFVTGRDIPFVRGLVDRGEVPAPAQVIGDVGTTIVEGATWAPIPAVQGFVEERWPSASGAQVHTLLRNIPGLTPQPTPFERRVSYFYTPGVTPVEAVVARVEAAGFDCLVSADTYLDVLPRGIHKGSALLRLLDHLGKDPAQTLVAGDTLNDRAMFESGLPGVVVGGAEPALVAAVADLPRTFVAEGVGCAGIWEALERLGHFADPDVKGGIAA